jgi:hypothetical protein
MADKPSHTAFIISVVILLVAIGFLVSMRSPTGSFLGITPCVDTDGEDPFTYGYARDLAGKTKFDECAGDHMVNEAFCEDGLYARQMPIACAPGKACADGVCEP